MSIQVWTEGKSGLARAIDAAAARAIGLFLFFGSTGDGKTALAEAMFGSEENIV